ncbi:AtpZ/AtpI family protein [Salsipaludibacter albus]|uniref:AtpZ/AtpI family protein n=1 Tax=Salsipaludibacter albus TaxID=2849650 RepID=UPI001EE44487|nr:AtpZ/AtpI family protein [Salsipaludibacter albus]MBY5163364.1 AtpZ/AtpI family protein [Salsipaludibacter albus]
MKRFDHDEIQDALRHDRDSGWALTAEFLSAILVWAGIGWLLDRWLDTGPWLLVAGIVLGVVLGFYLLYMRHRAASAEHYERFRYR